MLQAIMKYYGKNYKRELSEALFRIMSNSYDEAFLQK